MSRFRTTRWSLVMDAREPSGEGRQALDALCRIYRAPVLSYVRRRVRGDAEAEDLTQAFFEQFLRLRPDTGADPARGRFRVYLLVALKRYLANQHAAAAAGKRGGGQRLLSLEDELGPAQTPIDDDAPDRAFERDWAATVVMQARQQLCAEAEAAGKLALFEALQPFLLEAPDRDDYAQVATRLGLRRNTLAVAIHRLRQRLHELVRALLADTVSDAAQLEAELATVRHSLEGSAR